jgi:ribosomal protein L11 methyltransferase
MNYTEVVFKIHPKSTGTEIMIALLSQIGYESFEESDEGLKAYIPSTQFSHNDINELSIFHTGEFNISYSHSEVKNQNWNEVWERSFDPVLIKNIVIVRAPFHKANNEVKYEIVIEPKMSFGTAHHETTSMMIEMMLDENLAGRSVLDIGCGTGILSILSEMLGAKKTDAIDNDDWAYDNAVENIRKNNCKNISVHLGDARLLKDEKFDCILANINKNVLLADMNIYDAHLISGGVLMISGFYIDDLNEIESTAKIWNLILDRKITKNEWVAARFVKTN